MTTVGHPSRMWMRALNLLLAAAALWGMVIRGTEPSEPVTRLRTAEFAADQSALEPQEIPRAADERDTTDVARRARPATERTGNPVPGQVSRENELGLTPREVEVLALLASGRSNGQIGKELFISTKTASTHVSNIIRKLAVTNRVEAATVAVQHRRSLP